MSSISRRQLAKGIAAGLAAGSAGRLMPEGSRTAADVHRHAPLQALTWTELYPGIWRARLGNPEPHTHVSSRLIPPAAERIPSLPRVPEPPLLSVHGAITARGCRLALPLDANELIYGFGLQLLSFQQRGKKRIIRVNADAKADSGDSHAPVPFYVTTSGYGVR